MSIRTHHLLTLGIAVVAVALLVLWPNQQTQDQNTLSPDSTAEFLAGDWYARWDGDNGEYTWMQYHFEATDYVVTASFDYFETGTYQVVKEALDGSIVIEKTWETERGQSVYELTIMPDRDQQTITFEGVTMTRIETE